MCGVSMNLMSLEKENLLSNRIANHALIELLFEKESRTLETIFDWF